MRKFIFLILVFFAGVSYAGETSQELIEKGDALFQKRAEGNMGELASAIPIEQALTFYMAAYQLGDNSPALAERLMKASYFYATYAERDTKKQKDILDKSIKIGEEALKKYPDDVGINYQMAGAWGRWGEANGILASARMGVAQKVRQHGEKVVFVNPSYAEGGGYRTLGRLHFKAPKIPFILSWPSKEEALKYLAKAVEAGSKNLTNHLFYAESLYHAEFYQDALKHLDIILNAELNPDKIVEDIRDKKEAEVLKKKIGEKYANK